MIQMVVAVVQAVLLLLVGELYYWCWSLYQYSVYCVEQLAYLFILAIAYIIFGL